MKKISIYLILFLLNFTNASGQSCGCAIFSVENFIFNNLDYKSENIKKNKIRKITVTKVEIDSNSVSSEIIYYNEQGFITKVVIDNTNETYYLRNSDNIEIGKSQFIKTYQNNKTDTLMIYAEVNKIINKKIYEKSRFFIKKNTLDSILENKTIYTYNQSGQLLEEVLLYFNQSYSFKKIFSLHTNHINDTIKYYHNDTLDNIEIHKKSKFGKVTNTYIYNKKDGTIKLYELFFESRNHKLIKIINKLSECEDSNEITGFEVNIEYNKQQFAKNFSYLIGGKTCKYEIEYE